MPADDIRKFVGIVAFGIVAAAYLGSEARRQREKHHEHVWWS